MTERSNTLAALLDTLVSIGSEKAYVTRIVDRPYISFDTDSGRPDSYPLTEEAFSSFVASDKNVPAPEGMESFTVIPAPENIGGPEGAFVVEAVLTPKTVPGIR